MEKKSALRILVVEDEALMRWSIGQALSAVGHTVVEASDGAAAVAALVNSPAADAILLDYRLPDSTDLALLTRIRRMAPLTPVVLMTAFATPALVDQARELGARDVLSKPFDIYEIEGVVRRVCRSPH